MKQYRKAFVRKAFFSDAKGLSERLTQESQTELNALSDWTYLKALNQSIITSDHAYSICLNNHRKVAGVFGVCPWTEEGVGVIWMLAGRDLKKVGVDFIRHAPEWISHLFGKKYHTLHNCCLESDTKTQRWLEFLGFRMHHVPNLGRNGEGFYHFYMTKGESEQLWEQQQ